MKSVVLKKILFTKETLLSADFTGGFYQIFWAKEEHFYTNFWKVEEGILPLNSNYEVRITQIAKLDRHYKNKNKAVEK